MGVSAGLLPPHWLWLCHLLYLGLLVSAIRHAEWHRLWDHRSLQHLLGAAIVGLMLLWQIRAGISPGLEIHFLGLTALTLAVGWSFAVIASSVALLGTTLVGSEVGEAFSFNALIACIVPISLSYLVCIIERYVGFRLFFAYIFICAFFGGALAVVGAGLLIAWLLWLADAYSMREIIDYFLIYLPLIAFPEGVVNGTIITGMLVYMPQYLKTLQPERYSGQS